MKGAGDGHVRQDGRLRALLLVQRAAAAQDEFDVGGEVAGADSQLEGVRIGESALPQSAARSGGEQQDLGRVGTVAAAGTLFFLAECGEFHLVSGDVLLVLLDGSLVLLLALPVLAEPLGGHHQGAHQAEEQHVDLLGEEPHADAEEHGHERQDELEARPVPLGGRYGHHEPPPGPQRRQPGRAVVGEAALAHRGEMRVRLGRPVEDE
ncbi:hypothetical protein [Streptomyces sp. SM1]|uniref:hypothetical protein n=1 Tax=Streptomyces sp. SM1 TaxID=402229 RepID=UPI002156610F|nr:hypothetical protein [Streptomyces sp. SM1]